MITLVTAMLLASGGTTTGAPDDLPSPGLLTSTTETFHGPVAWHWVISGETIREIPDSGVLQFTFTCLDTECSGRVTFNGLAGAADCTLTTDGLWAGGIQVGTENPDLCTSGSWGHTTDPNTEPPLFCTGTASVGGTRLGGSGGGFGSCQRIDIPI